jgi:hypothetical protein
MSLQLEDTVQLGVSLQLSVGEELGTNLQLGMGKLGMDLQLGIGEVLGGILQLGGMHDGLLCAQVASCCEQIRSSPEHRPLSLSCRHATPRRLSSWD